MGKLKYRNKPTRAMGILFPSEGEAKRYIELTILAKAGKIEDFHRQVEFKLLSSKRRSDGRMERGVKYFADFVYKENGKTVVEDFKGKRTPEYILKRKLMLHVHGIEIREVTR